MSLGSISVIIGLVVKQSTPAIRNLYVLNLLRLGLEIEYRNHRENRNESQRANRASEWLCRLNMEPSSPITRSLLGCYRTSSDVTALRFLHVFLSLPLCYCYAL